jgi:serine/threonine protein kinase
MTSKERQMGCPEIEILERYVRGGVDAAQRAAVESHLGVCAECAKKLEELRGDEEMLRSLREATKDVTGNTSRGGVETVAEAQSLLGERYRVTRKVGEGGTGQVYQAMDTVLERHVAVKFLRKPAGAEAEPWREARLASKMNHPNIAQVYEIGQAGERRFIVMEWVDGVAITDAWHDMPLERRLGIYLGVLEAVAAAHRQGIVHRDIKPSNIVVAGGARVKVLDFGIAHEWTIGDVEQTVFRGTPSYSAPEQVTPPVKISPATDVFALGVLLYQLLTDSLPFPQRGQRELFDAIRNEYPQLPSAIQERTPIALQNICLKALEKDPEKRYPDAQGLCDDIGRFLRGEKVWSRPSFLVDKVQQEVFYHRQQFSVWHQNELITQKEFDRLEGIYEAMLAPPDPSIIEARQLSLSQVCLYLGGWLAVLGSFVLFYKNWEQIPLYWRPAPAIAATIVMIAGGVAMWRRAESRLAVGILATANLLVPVTMLLTMGQWNVLGPAANPWGTESIADILDNFNTHVIVGNVQVYLSAACWLGFSLFLLRLTRSSIFVVFSIAAFLAWLTSCYIIGDMQNWQPDIIAGRYLYAGIGLFVFGTLLDRRGLRQYAVPLAWVGLAVMVLSLSGIAASEQTLFGWLGHRPEFFEENESRLLSSVCNGVFYLALAGMCIRLGTRMQRGIANALNWLGPLHILFMLRVLDSDDMHLPEARRMVYRFILPFASLAFVFGSVARQMKSFFFSGLTGIAVSVHKLTIEHLDKFFAWPISLIVTGIVWMAVSWLVPRWKASSAIKKSG